MQKTKLTALGAVAVLAFSLGTPSFVGACGGDCPPPPPPEETGGNPGNGKPVGNSPWDGITGNSGNNNPGPRAAPMEGQEPDSPYPQPGGKGNGPSNANKD